ncbi:MAG: membrane protein insertase YidC [Syntrophales bacterium]|jgi:YidC/Oxa1 family membrane protein insertase|nr:membrane protein insertase YidC [Syntrophales bacterium]MCK9528377.1 membrane protein insertase YidC [Syntrophales bacterium]MDX9922698.1 membrane protein insertase YidC [Syntrophales bacterium]
MDKKAILAIVLSLALLAIYQFFFVRPPAKPASETTTAVTETAPPQTVERREQQVASPVEPAARSMPFEAPREVFEEETIPVSTPLYRAVMSSRGGSLASITLNNYRKTIDDDSDFIELVNVRPDMVYPLTVTFPESNIDIPANARFSADREGIDLTRGAQRESLVFTLFYPGEIKVEKKYTFHSDSYTIDLEIRVYNLSGVTLTQNAQITWHEHMDTETKADRFSHIGPVAYINDSLLTVKQKNMGEPQFHGPEVLWGGYQSKYFIAAIIADQPSLSTMTIAKGAHNEASVSLRGPRSLIPPGQSGVFEYTCYLGPKEYDILKNQNVFLEQAINYGSWIKWLALPLLKGLKIINSGVKNYGVAIIILTIIVKICFWPLGTISYKSMKQMQRLQPEMAKIKEKYKDNKQKLQEETMSLYRAHNINPLSGCLPIMIQIPVFFGLYRALLFSIELRHSPFFFWIQDLSAKDPYYVTPIIMGASMFLQQRMTPTPVGNEMQAKIMTWMPVMFTFLFLNFPAGLVIYWLFNNILSIGQQYWINKRT